MKMTREKMEMVFGRKFENHEFHMICNHMMKNKWNLNKLKMVHSTTRRSFDYLITIPSKIYDNIINPRVAI